MHSWHSEVQGVKEDHDEASRAAAEDDATDGGLIHGDLPADDAS